MSLGSIAGYIHSGGDVNGGPDHVGFRLPDNLALVEVVERRGESQGREQASGRNKGDERGLEYWSHC